MENQTPWKFIFVGILVMLKIGLACARLTRTSSYDSYASSGWTQYPSNAYLPSSPAYVPSVPAPKAEPLEASTTTATVREKGVPVTYAVVEVLPMTKAEKASNSGALVEGTGRDVALSFDAETSAFPNGHHLLLADVAELAGRDLKGVRFEELAPTDEEDLRGEGHYTLIAFMDGKRYAVKARDLGDWYDVPATVGLVNTLLKERKSAARVVTLETGDQTVKLRADSVAALAKTPLAWAAPDDAMKDGKAFEAKALEALERELAKKGY